MTATIQANQGREPLTMTIIQITIIRTSYESCQQLYVFLLCQQYYFVQTEDFSGLPGAFSATLRWEIRTACVSLYLLIASATSSLRVKQVTRYREVYAYIKHVLSAFVWPNMNCFNSSPVRGLVDEYHSSEKLAKRSVLEIGVWNI